MRDSLRALLGVPCFIRRSRSADALFVTDALARGGEEALERLSLSPDWHCRREGGLLQADPSPALWQRLMGEAPLCMTFRMDGQTPWPFLLSCAARLAEKTVPPDVQPVMPLRMTLKYLEAGEIERLQQELPPIVAELQRRRLPLPQAAGQYILSYISH